jgi:hypothetical protein
MPNFPTSGVDRFCPISPLFFLSLSVFHISYSKYVLFIWVFPETKRDVPVPLVFSPGGSPLGGSPLSGGPSVPPPREVLNFSAFL